MLNSWKVAIIDEEGEETIYWECVWISKALFACLVHAEKFYSLIQFIGQETKFSGWKCSSCIQSFISKTREGKHTRIADMQLFYNFSPPEILVKQQSWFVFSFFLFCTMWSCNKHALCYFMILACHIYHFLRSDHVTWILFLWSDHSTCIMLCYDLIL